MSPEAQTRALSAVLSKTAFVENAGQWDGRARYQMSGRGVNLWLTQEGARYQFTQAPKGGDKNRRTFALQLSFAGGRPLNLNASKQLPGLLNYATGSGKEAKMLTGVRRFEGIEAKNVYPGIDVQFGSTNGLPRYDVIVQPGADPAKVAIKFEGVQSVRKRADGVVELETPVGKFEHKDLLAYQGSGESRKVVPCTMTCEGTTLHFQPGAYDRTKPLVIDPVLAGTYFGTIDDQLKKVASAAGRVMLTGTTYSAAFPVSLGLAAQGTSGVFVSQLTGDLKNLIYSTFTDKQQVYDACLDDNGKVSIVSNFHVYSTLTELHTFTAYLQQLDSSGKIVRNTAIDSFVDSVYNSPVYDADFKVATNHQGTVVGVAELTNYSWNHGTDGSNLSVLRVANTDSSTTIYTTYNPDSKEGFRGIAVSESGDIAVCGYTTEGGGYPTTAGAYNPAGNSSLMPEGYVTVLDQSLGMLGSTYFVGTDGSTFPNSVAFDSKGNVIIAGGVISTTLPVSPGAFQNSMHGNADAFVAKFSPHCSQLEASTYFGGYGDDSASFLAIGKDDSLWISGTTGTGPSGFYDLPRTETFEVVHDQPASYIAGLSSDAKLLGYSVLWHHLAGIDLDDSWRIVVGGQTNDGITTGEGAYIAGGTSSATIYVNVLSTYTPVATVSAAPTTVFGGATSTGFVSLKSVVSGTPAIVKLASSDPHTVVPTEVQVSPGSSTATFPIVTKAVAGPLATTITATSGVTKATATLNLVSGLGLGATITSDDTTLISGQSIKVTVSIGTPQAVDVSAALSSSLPAAIPMPTTVTIPKGQTSVAFNVATNGVAATSAVHLYVNLYGSKAHADLTISPATLTTFTMTPSSVVGGKASVGRVNLNGLPGPAGSVYNLTSANSFLHFPATVTVPAGTKTAVFTVNTDGTAAIQTGQIKASKGTDVKTTNLTVTPATLSGVKLTVTTVKSGSSVGGTITLNGKAPAGGLVVSLSSNTPSATVPATVKVLPGTSSVGFAVTTLKVTSNKTVTITAKSGAQTFTATLTLTP